MEHGTCNTLTEPRTHCIIFTALPQTKYLLPFGQGSYIACCQHAHQLEGQITDTSLLRSYSPSRTALTLGKRMPRKRMIRTLLTLQWHLMAKNFDDQCTSKLERRSNCTWQEKKGGCERKKKGLKSLLTDIIQK